MPLFKPRDSLLLSIQDDEKHELPYLLAMDEAPHEAPILLRFHGWGGNTLPEKMSVQAQGHPGWNVVAPMDRYGWNRQGSWWLGEDGNYFLLTLMDKIIEQLRNEYKLEGRIYSYGSSMGGFGAAMHGLRQRCPVIVLNVPQTCIAGNNYGQYHQAKIRPVFGELFDQINRPGNEEVDEENAKVAEARLMSDVAAYVRTLPDDYKPLIYLFQTRFDTSDGEFETGNAYIRSQTLHLIDALIDRTIPFELFVENKNAHYVHWNWKDAIKMIEELL
jgi:hypothetical protein